MAAAAPAPSADSIRAATLRLMSDLKAITADCPPGVSASPLSESDLFTWVASIVGPDESPFEGGIFQLRIQFPDQYPEKPPRVRFITEVCFAFSWQDCCTTATASVACRGHASRPLRRLADHCALQMFHPNLFPDGTLCLDILQVSARRHRSQTSPLPRDLPRLGLRR